VLADRSGRVAGEDRGRVRERLDAHHVVSEQGEAVEAERSSGGLVCDEALRVRDVAQVE
jgi:hypothetical protein